MNTQPTLQDLAAEIADRTDCTDTNKRTEPWLLIQVGVNWERLDEAGPYTLRLQVLRDGEVVDTMAVYHGSESDCLRVWRHFEPGPVRNFKTGSAPWDGYTGSLPA